MRLDELVVDLRPRTPWEGMDLGVRLAQRYYRELFLLWWLPALPVLLVGLLLLHDRPEWLAVLLWWAKPAFEPLLVHWLGRTLFGDPLPLRRAAAGWPRVVLPRLLPNLTWRRLSPNRSLYMPVTVLEGLRGRAWSARAAVLSGRRSDGAWLTIAGVHFEGVLQVALVFGVLTLLPEAAFSGADFGLAFGDGPAWGWVWLAAQLLAMSIVAPFYVAGGFALYLTRRTRLEGWDLELQFRRIAARFAMALPIAPALLLGGMLAGAEPAVAQPVTPELARAAAAEVLAHDDFGEWRTVTTWVRKEQDEAAARPPGRQLDLGWVAGTLRLLLWVAAALGLAWLLYWMWRWRGRWIEPRRGPPPPGGPDVALFDPRPVEAALPRDVPAAALALAEADRAREALGLLYRASLARLAGRYALAVPAAATEQECRRLVAQHRPQGQAGYFTRLTEHWIAAAYAHQSPPGEELRALCRDWAGHFEGVADAG